MISGRFGDTSGRPYIEARVTFTRLKTVIQIPSPGEADVSFLADTGADQTTIMPADWTRFSVDLSRLIAPFTIYGVGGKADGFKEPAIITLLEPSVGLRTYTTDIVIVKPGPYIMDCASLLGRDVLKNWSITFDKTNNRVSARVLRADHTFKFTKQVAGLTPLAGVAPPRMWS
jgi:hypothetical protein